MRLDRNAIGMVQASFMDADPEGWDRADALIETLPKAERAPMRDRMVKEALRQQVAAQGRAAVLRTLSDLGTHRSGGGNYAARIGKAQMETALRSLSDFVRTLPE